MEVKKLMEKVASEMAHDVAYFKVINRCTVCGRTVTLLVPKKEGMTKVVLWMERAKNVQCSDCNPKSNWKVDEDGGRETKNV